MKNYLIMNLMFLICISCNSNTGPENPQPEIGGTYEMPVPNGRNVYILKENQTYDMIQMVAGFDTLMYAGNWKVDNDSLCLDLQCMQVRNVSENGLELFDLGQWWYWFKIK